MRITQMILFRLCFTIAIGLFALFSAPDAFAQANRNGVHLSSAAAIYVAEGNVLIDQSSNIGKLLDQNFVHHSCFFRQLRLNSRPVVINSS